MSPKVRYEAAAATLIGRAVRYGGDLIDKEIPVARLARQFSTDGDHAFLPEAVIAASVRILISIIDVRRFKKRAGGLFAHWRRAYFLPASSGQT